MDSLFFYGLCFLLGSASQIVFHPVYLFAGLIFLFFWRARLISGMFTIGIGYLCAVLSVTLPSLPEEGVQGIGVFHPESVSYGHSPFGTSYITKGMLQFTTASDKWKRVPCHIYTPLHKPRPPGDSSFKVEGRLLPKKFPHYVLKPSSFESLPSYAGAEWRFQIKDRLRQHFHQLFSSPPTSAFLLSMVTGEIDDRLMSLQFNRLGLLHLLGISGFQFSLLALLLGSLLRLMLPFKIALWTLMVLLSAYAFILGGSPPIERAWIGVTLYVLALLWNLQITPLNGLGAALIWELAWDPTIFFHLGFQFSFLCTAAIFIVYPQLKQALQKIFPPRSFIEIRSFSIMDRIGHVLSFCSREALALNLAIHLVSLPLIFFHFHKFPLLSLIYNLFLPPFVSLAYLFLIPALVLQCFSHVLALPFLKITAEITHALLQIAAHPPTLFDFQWRIPSCTLGPAVISLTILFCLTQILEKNMDRLTQPLRHLSKIFCSLFHQRSRLLYRLRGRQ